MSGVYASAGGRWRVNWYDDVGKKRTSWHETKEAAEAKAAELAAQLERAAGGGSGAPPSAPSMAPRELSTGEWRGLLGAAAMAAMERPRDDDARALLRSLAQAATAAGRLADLSEMERDIAELEDTLRMMRMREQHGLGPESPPVTAEEPV